MRDRPVEIALPASYCPQQPSIGRGKATRKSHEGKRDVGDAIGVEDVPTTAEPDREWQTDMAGPP